MDSEELRAWLRLTLTPGVGNGAARKLLATFGSAPAIFDQSSATLRQLGSDKLASVLLSDPPTLAAQLQTTVQWLEDGEDRCLAVLGDTDYPAALLDIEDPPLMLYMLGVQAKRAYPATKIVANLIAPHAFEVASIADVKAEIFGPVLQVVRWGGDPADVITQINALGYGLTCGIQTRIDSRAQALAHAAHVGNIYINRNMIGAVVGVQPFGGEGLSGTGPKAGGPHYLYRFCAEQTITVNTTAAGGNAALLAGQH